MQAPALQHTRLASLNLRKQPSGHPRASRLIVSASQQSKSLLKLQIAFSTEFGDSLAIVDSKSGWASEKAVPLQWSDGDQWRGELQADTGCGGQFRVHGKLGLCYMKEGSCGDAVKRLEDALCMYVRPLEYKYVLRRGEEVTEWQPGDNLVVDVPSEPSVIIIEDRWNPTEGRSVQVQRSADLSGGSDDSSAKAAAPTATPAAATPAASSSAAEVTDAAPSPPAGASPDNGKELSKLKVPELKELLKANGLQVSGKKAELIERLQEANVQG